MDGKLSDRMGGGWGGGRRMEVGVGWVDIAHRENISFGDINTVMFDGFQEG